FLEPDMAAVAETAHSAVAVRMCRARRVMTVMLERSPQYFSAQYIPFREINSQ
ncbi:MAG: hypothetical protein ACI9XZ_004303, partial [Alphaproteobacteria bacterium]